MTFFLFKIFSAILNFLAPQQKPNVPTPGKLADVNFPRAAEGDPVGRVYGTVKIMSPNTLWDGDFLASPIKKKVSTGLFSHKKETIGYNYKVGMDLGLCLGPGFVFKRIWLGTYELWNGCLTGCVNVLDLNLPNLFGGTDNKNGNSGGGFIGRISLYCGNFDQEPNAYLQRVIFPDNADQVPAYNGIAHMVFEQPVWGTSTSIQPVYVEGSCFFDSLNLGPHAVMSNGLDMNPIAILHHIFNDDWGNLGIDAAKINAAQWTTAAETVWVANNGASMQVTSQGQAEDAIKALLSQINATIYENPATGLYDLVLLQDDYVIADLPVYGSEQVLSIQNFTKTLWSQTQNVQRVKFTDRTQGYKADVTAQAQDFANIRFQGKVLSNELTSETIYDPIVANNVAARELANINVPLYSMTLTLNRMAYALPPGTPFVFNWPEYGIVSMVLRVRKAGLGTLEDGMITLDVVQDVFSVADAIMAPPVTGPYVKPSQLPVPIVTSVRFELPYFLDYNGQLQTPAGAQSMAVFAKSPSSYSIAFNAYIAANGGDAEVLDTAEFAPTANLTAALGQFDGFANGIVPTMIVGGMTDDAVLVDGPVTSGSGLFMLNGEILAYESFALNGDGTYTLTNVHRALLDTTYVGGAIGDALYFFDGQEAVLGQSFVIGQIYELKLADITTNGEFATPAEIELEPIGRMYLPIPPDNVTVGGARSATGSIDAGTTATVAWSPRSALASPSAIPLELDPAQAVDGGETWKLEVIDQTGTVLLTEDGLTEPTYDLAFSDSMAPRVVLNIWSELNGKLSFTSALYPIAVLGELLIDGDPVTIDGIGISI